MPAAAAEAVVVEPMCATRYPSEEGGPRQSEGGLVSAGPEPWQLLPPLSAEEYEALKADIAAHGLRVPIVVDAASGLVVDGHHRQRALEELRAGGLKVADYRDVRRFGDDEERVAFVLAANLFRRHLSRAQRNELVGFGQPRVQGRAGRSSCHDCHLHRPWREHRTFRPVAAPSSSQVSRALLMGPEGSPCFTSRRSMYTRPGNYWCEPSARNTYPTHRFGVRLPAGYFR
jgi:hypothetical protein